MTASYYTIEQNFWQDLDESTQNRGKHQQKIMKAKKFRPSKTAMQSGRAKEKSWKLIIDDGSHQTKDPLIGWNGGATTKSQINLFFSS